MAAARYVSIFQPSNAKTLAQRQASMDVASNLRMTGVRFDILPRFFAPTRATRDYSYLSDHIDYARSKGLSIMLTGAYGPLGGDWTTGSEKIIHASDKTDAVTAFMDGLNYVINTKGVPESQLIVEMWNEPDQTNFGAVVAGQFNASNVAYFNALAPVIRSTYPNLKLAGPSFSYSASGGTHWQSTVWEANCSVNDVHWQYYDYVNMHLYLNMNNTVPALGREQVRKLANLSLNNFRAQLATVTASSYLVGKPLIVSEFGFDFINAGLGQSTWAFGGELDRAKYIMEAYSAMAGREDVVAVNFYNAINYDVSDDSRSDTQHYGMCDSAGNAYALYQEVAKAGGFQTSSLPGSGSLIEPS